MENHTNKTYQERMNQTASSKFGAIEKHLDKGVKILDFGSGFSPEFIEQVTKTGSQYVAYDVSHIVQNQLKENNIGFLTKEQLKNTENEFDVIYLSSVFHELLSYLSRPERRETFTILDKALKPDGVIVIRDWGPGYHKRELMTLEVASNDVADEIYTWVQTLIKNAVINKPRMYPENSTAPHTYKHAPHQLYEIMFHVVWGLDSLERESQESYEIDPYYIQKWICQPHGYEITNSQEEYDQNYLPYLQKYFKIDNIPWPTKIIYELRKTK